MIVALLFLVFIGCGYLWASRGRRSPRAILPVPERQTTGVVTHLGLEDDPDRWDASRVAWTALDEHQLTRLLRESAPIEGVARNPTDDAAPRADHGDVS